LLDVAEENSEIIIKLYVEHPLVLPYQLGPDDKGYVVIMTMVLQFLGGSLRNLFTKHASLGGYAPR